MKHMSFLPMGSLCEGAQFLLCELLVMMLKERLGETPTACGRGIPIWSEISLKSSAPFP